MDPVSRRFMWDLIISRPHLAHISPHLAQVSRRFMWDLITAERQRRSIVLTYISPISPLTLTLSLP